VVSGGSSSSGKVIDRKSFKDLAAKQDKKRFKRWTSVGV
jgi:hypothetical protein